MLRQALAMFGKSATNEAADRIVAAVSAAARDPELFGDARAPDTFDGRFEMATLFSCLALHRLRASPDADKVAQVFTDRLFRLFDAGLREAGVGDLTVPKRMKKIAAAFYGRLNAYAPVFSDEAALAAALSRNVWGVEAHPFAPALAQRVSSLWSRIAGLAPAAIESPDVWNPTRAPG